MYLFFTLSTDHGQTKSCHILKLLGFVQIFFPTLFLSRYFISKKRFKLSQTCSIISRALFSISSSFNTFAKLVSTNSCPSFLFNLSDRHLNFFSISNSLATDSMADSIAHLSLLFQNALHNELESARIQLIFLICLSTSQNIFC